MDPPREGTEGAVGAPEAVGPKSRSVALRIILAAAIVATVGALATARLFVWPPSDAPTSADAVVVLSGDHGERLARALILLGAGVARTLVYDGAPDSTQARELCEKPQGFEVVCLRPDPDNTRAEAYAAGRLALNRDWKTVVVVTSTQHVTRAGLLFRRCVDATVDMVEAHPGFGVRLTARLIVSEWVKVAYSVTVERGC